jgi:hypothetical protein
MNPSVFDGTFYGTFTITNNMGVEETGAVTFTFSGDKYRCIPEKKYLPPGGGGLFKTIGQALVLNDTMTHTAEFDHTLILNGAFSYTYDGSHLVLYQDDQQYLRFRRIDLTRQ